MSFSSVPKLAFLSRPQSTDSRPNSSQIVATTESLRRANDALEASCKGFVFNEATRQWLHPVVALLLFVVLGCVGCADLATSGTCSGCILAGGSPGVGGTAAIGGAATPTTAPTAAPVRIIFIATAGTATDEAIDTTVELVNVSRADIELTGLSLRYWFADDGPGIIVDARTGPAGQRITHCLANPAQPGADHYIEIALTTGILVSSGAIRVTFAAYRSDWSSFNESDDYSWPGSTSEGDELLTVAVYRSGSLVAGVAP